MKNLTETKRLLVHHAKKAYRIAGSGERTYRYKQLKLAVAALLRAEVADAN